MTGKLLREIVVISGKGGTGKTSLCAAFAALASGTVFCDLDVDVPDLHIILKPTIRKKTPFLGGRKAMISPSLCSQCGTCRDVCHFDAVSCTDGTYTVDPMLCEGCTVCAACCPSGAVTFRETQCGEYYTSGTRFGPFIHAQLTPGEENSGRLVALLKQEARAEAEALGYTTILCDGSPGTGCPVVSSLAGASLAVLCIEPSLSGLHDLDRIISVCRHFRLPSGVVINKADLHPEGTARIESYLREKNHVLFGHVPFDPLLVQLAAQGRACTEEEGPLRDAVKDIWKKVLSLRPARTAAAVLS